MVTMPTLAPDSLMLNFVILAFGIIILVKGSDSFIKAISGVAEDFGVSEFIISVFLASFATTLPEISVSVLAAIEGQSGLSVGNIIGSNLANILLIFGTIPLLKEIISPNELEEKSLFLIGSTILLIIFMKTGRKIGKTEGLVLIFIYLLYLTYNIKKHFKPEEIPEEKTGYGFMKDFFYLGLGLAGIFLGSRLMVSNGVKIAIELGVPEIIIGLTVIALGTSLPELTNAIMATIKGKHGISIGNIIGANTINNTFSLGLIAIISEIPANNMLNLHLPILLISVLLLTGIA
ncbi:MAG: calcium/sodium antiporter, partial [Halanaerobiales bacterium]